MVDLLVPEPAIQAEQLLVFVPILSVFQAELCDLRYGLFMVFVKK